jgi:hypothetical protein
MGVLGFPSSSWAFWHHSHVEPFFLKPGTVRQLPHIILFQTKPRVIYKEEREEGKYKPIGVYKLRE